ncbi:hypothetical protein JKP88DRAFT_348665 [Tribonema minus]|uniref:Spore protein YkvP/CgeB glycosyl transferase-like domain-containing protein n=1 Tax=Tribonema minus TaxID=303371 RepID=A0A835YZ66_9STRA|nr:hypothetical protein JKP88DRAFT_348665 [Tribonema minus]
MCPNNHDHPWDNMIREGIHMHPLVDLIHSDRHKEADYIIHIADREEQMREEEGGRVCPGPFPKKTLVMDETDRPYLAIDESWQKDVEIADVSYLRTKYLALFKRSFVEKDTSEPVKQLLGFRVPASTRPSQFPIQYPILQKFLREGSFPQWEQRKLDISTLLRDEFYEQDQPEGTVKTGARSIAQQWMQKYVDEHNITRYHRGTNDGDRGEADRGYFEVLWETKILVTCNPSFWEGDHRTGEALAAGAMVLVDIITGEALAAGAMTLVDVMWAPRQFPLISGWHAILYDASDEEDFMDKLHYYHTHDDEARKVAARGLYHAQRYFNTATFVDYVLITAEELTGRAAKHEYVRTGLQVLKDFNHMYDIQQRSIYPWRR